MSHKPEVIRAGVLSMQVCVPQGLPDAEVVTFAEQEFPCGTTNGWHIRKTGDNQLNGDAERVICASDPNKVHIMLDA